MNETQRRANNAEKLLELAPTMRPRIAAVIADLEGHGFRPRIQEAWRSPAKQLAAFRSKRSQRRFGFHNVTNKDGTPAALAVDLLDDDAPLAPSTKYILMLAASARSHRCQTGLAWGLPAQLSKGIDAAIAARNWTAKIKIGWDPCHLEPTDVSVAAARKGARPAA